MKLLALILLVAACGHKHRFGPKPPADVCAKAFPAATVPKASPKVRQSFQEYMNAHLIPKLATTANSCFTAQTNSGYWKNVAACTRFTVAFAGIRGVKFGDAGAFQPPKETLNCLAGGLKAIDPWQGVSPQTAKQLGAHEWDIILPMNLVSYQ